jgi:hypothetical protein
MTLANESDFFEDELGSETLLTDGSDGGPAASDGLPARPTDPTKLLNHIADMLEHRQRKRWAEIVSAIVLSFATTASAWCAYQSNRWGGVQTFRLAAANKSNREASTFTLEANQYRQLDVTMFMDYARAVHGGDGKTERFLYDRFRPEMKVAVDAWLRADGWNSASAPTSPFKMPEYVLKDQVQARAQSEDGERLMAAAQSANDLSDTYVLLTVLFASVLFFGGIGGTFQSRRLRRFSLVAAIALFTITFTIVATMPICHE